MRICREWSGSRVQWGRPVGQHDAVAQKISFIAATAFGLEAVLELSGHMADEGRKEFQNILFSKIVPNCKKLGLLDAGDAWLRRRFEELGVIQFEDQPDTGEEYDMFALAEGRV